MDSRAITRRLDTLQKITDSQRPSLVTVTFTDGSKIVVPFDDVFSSYDDDGKLIESEIERRGWAGEVVALEGGDWRDANILALFEALWRPNDDH